MSQVNLHDDALPGEDSPAESHEWAEFRQRLDAVLEMNGLPKRGRITKLHETLNRVSWSTARKLVSGEAGYPRAETLTELQRELNVSIDWLLTGRGTPLLDGPHKSNQSNWDAVVFLRLPNGHAEEVQVVPGRKGPEALSIVKIEDDAMAPDLTTGDYVIVNSAVTAIELGVIYMLRAHGRTLFRRLEASTLEDGWRLVPRNAAMAPEHVPAVSLPGQPLPNAPIVVAGKIEKKLLAKV